MATIDTGSNTPDSAPLTYRGWRVYPATYIGWEAISPNYDASWEGEEDGWVDNGQKAWGKDWPACKAEVDAWFEENTTCTSCDGLNTSCPEGCGRDPSTGELDGSRCTCPAHPAKESN